MSGKIIKAYSAESVGEMERALGDAFGLCGCGRPDSVLRLALRVLRFYNRRDDDWRAALKEAYEVDEPLSSPLVWAFIYRLDDLDLTEHGGSAWCGWLTPKGEEMLSRLEEWAEAADNLDTQPDP